MITETFEFERRNIFDLLFPYLNGHVFHVTIFENLSGIQKSGAIQPNTKGNFKTSFDFSGNSFFRKRGCVSLFDYREIDEELFNNYGERCLPTLPFFKSNRISVLFLSEEAFPKLISSEQRHKEKALNEYIVPYFEAGYQGQIELRLITKIINVIAY